MPPSPRILFLSDHLGHPEGRVHGATTYFLITLPALQATGLPLTVCFLRPRHPSAARLEAAGIHPVFLGRGKWDIRALNDLIRLIRKHDINLVHAAGMKGILLGRLAARRTGARFIAHLHDINPLDPVTKFLQRRSAPWTHACLGISRAVCTYATDTLAIPPDRVHLLTNPLPLEPYAPPDPADLDALRDSLGLTTGHRVIGCIARLSPEKGHEPFLRDIADTLKNRPALRLLLVGDGPLRPEISSLTRNLGIEDAVLFTGHRDDVPALLHLMDVLAIPSHREGLGYTALEAMAAGTPVAAFAVGGVPEIVQHGHTGLLSPPGDTPDLIANILRLLDDPALSSPLIAHGKKFVQSFSTTRHVEALAQHYRET